MNNQEIIKNSGSNVSVRSREEILERVKNDQKRELTTDELASLPVVDDIYFKDVESSFTDEDKFEWVDSKNIIGRPGAEYFSGGWAREYDNRQGRIRLIAEQLLKSNDDYSIEDIFHFNKPRERIKLNEYNGPAGPIYTVQDGTHRVAGCKAAGLERIPCQVRKMIYPIEKIEHSHEKIRDWEIKARLGLIDEDITEESYKNGVRYKVVIRNEVLPWIRVTSQSRFIKITELYEQLYPGSLDNLGFPKEAFLDPVANNFLLDGRIEEWKSKYLK